MKDIAVVNACK